ncbi:MAG: hypothetical protein AAGJ82_16070 [Bacteroidota bacterium]
MPQRFCLTNSPFLALTLLVIVAFFHFTPDAAAQDWNRDNTPRALLFNFGYGPELPGGDMERRFGLTWSPEISVDYMTLSNWTIGLQWQYLLGPNVKEDVLQGLRTSTGAIIGTDRSPAQINLTLRGFYLGGQIGRLISLSEKNTRAGLRLNLGAGILQHRINVQDDPLRTVAPLTGDYLAGYDRLTNGLAIHQFIGYQVIGIRDGINITAGFEFTQAFTKNRRNYDFATQMRLDENRFDSLVGFRFSFTLPLWLGNAEEIFY